MYAVNLTSPTGGACLGEEVQPSVAALARETAQIVHLRDLLAGGHGLAGAARLAAEVAAADRVDPHRDSAFTVSLQARCLNDIRPII